MEEGSVKSRSRERLHVVQVSNRSYLLFSRTTCSEQILGMRQIGFQRALSIWTEFHNCITFGCTSLSVFLGGRRNPCLNMSYGPSSLPHGHLSFPAILCLSWSEGFRFFPLSLRIACDRWDVIVEISSGLELPVFSWPTIGGCWKRRKGKVVLKRDCYQF